MNIYRIELLMPDGYRIDTFCADDANHAEYLTSIAHRKKDFVILTVMEM
jgi:hypothetical protein